VGALEPRKGLEVLVAAAAQAAADGRPWRVALAGRPAYRGEEIARQAQATPGCVVLGGVEDDDLVELYRAAEAIAVPSLYEGFGLTPLEAMACGTPAVIAGNAGALEEISGHGAVVVEDRTPSAWVAGIERALAERSALVARASTVRYEWDDAVAGTREALAEAAGIGLGRVPESEPMPR
jgi:glycosyltransferase involved in cell wall biosynthesis